MCCMSCWEGLLSPAGEALAGAKMLDMGGSGTAVPPAEGAGGWGGPRDPRLQGKNAFLQQRSKAESWRPVSSSHQKDATLTLSLQG